MGDTTIEWTATRAPDGTLLGGFTFNAWIGCEKVSPGCKHCYASVHTYARVSRSRGLPLWGPGSHRHVTGRGTWAKPERWNREAELAGIRRKVFCSSLSDVFEDRPELEVPRARLFMLVVSTPWLDWLLLTKRPQNADRLWRRASCKALTHVQSPWLKNVWLGTTVEDQERADERIGELSNVQARVRFLSCEPLLGHIRLGGAIDWVIVGSESGPKARPMPLDAAASIVTQCRAQGVPVFVKQIANEHDRKGGNPIHWPAGDWPREFPEPRA